MDFKESKTLQNLKDAFAGESMANRRYLYFAKQADVEGLPDIAGLFRDTAEGETGHAHGHLDYLKKVGDPATGLPMGDTQINLRAAIHGETHEYTDMYPGMARTARSILPTANQANDQPTQDLLTQRMQIHEKTAWMLRSLLA